MKPSRYLALLSCATSLLSSLAAATEPAGPTADSALQRLQDGNRRFVTQQTIRPDQSPEHRAEIAKGQHPFAIVLTCADSRVAPELYFDQGFGDIFVIRNAGNVLDDHVIGSIEYAVEHLHVPLILVVGHEKCGAVAASVAGGHAPGKIGSIVESIAPAVNATAGQAGDRVDHTVRTHAQLVAATLARTGPIVAEGVRHGGVKILAARYDLDTGVVEFLPDLPAGPTSADTPAPAQSETGHAAEGHAAPAHAPAASPTHH